MLFDGGGYVYRVHPINVQLVAHTVIMPAKEEHGCDSGSESLDKQEPRDILHPTSFYPTIDWFMRRRCEAVIARGGYTRY
jgi:hypothetical protein